MKHPFVIFIAILLSTMNLWAQDGAAIAADENMHDFGLVVESEGSVSYTFVVKNSGSAPLVITRVTASCGCTTPEWTKEPIPAGSTGNIKITYNPKGRPGPFMKRIAVFSNGKKGAFNLNIKGNVVSKPLTPAISYPYSIGDLKLETKTISFNNIRPDETSENKISVKNESSKDILIGIGKLPNYIRINLPEKLSPGESGEISISFDAEMAKRMGRVMNELPITVENGDKKATNGTIDISANIIDNFSRWSSSQRSNGPVANIPTTLIDFGTVEEKGSFIPGLGGGKTSENISITNTGKSTLTIYSITCNSDLVDITAGKKDIKPGASATYKITIRPKEIKSRMEALIHVVCNDPNGPVRLIKVTARK